MINLLHNVKIIDYFKKVHNIDALSQKTGGLIRKSDYTTYGRGQIIVKDPQTGVLCGGTEARTDGSIAAF